MPLPPAPHNRRDSSRRINLTQGNSRQIKPNQGKNFFWACEFPLSNGRSRRHAHASLPSQTRTFSAVRHVRYDPHILYQLGIMTLPFTITAEAKLSSFGAFCPMPWRACRFTVQRFNVSRLKIQRFNNALPRAA
jgi:hypothetical protein